MLRSAKEHVCIEVSDKHDFLNPEYRFWGSFLKNQNAYTVSITFFFSLDSRTNLSVSYSTTSEKPEGSIKYIKTRIDLIMLFFTLAEQNCLFSLQP